ncbi:ATP-binding protein [Sphaerisporangium fuscum]|uniref:ATP-binding protein n=1 Tax=Sphaerisporangium fuscum TaxID=2835868 RepID=UPI001BDBF582|nr:ATP-binding protein [Sphaerisporangium fuscum]
MTSALVSQPIRALYVLRHETFKAALDQISLARRLVEEALAGHPAAEVAILLVSELTANSVQHSGSTSFTVVIAITSDHSIHVNVIDDGYDGLPQLLYGEFEDEHGCGIRFVDQFAKRWGVTRERAVGMAIWFALETEASHPAGINPCAPTYLKPSLQALSKFPQGRAQSYLADLESMRLSPTRER